MTASGCTICQGTGWLPKGTPARMERCECWKQGFATYRLQAAKIPSMYGRCSFDQFTVYENEQLVRALESARRFVQEFPAVTRGLCLIGPPGIGKTHLAVAALRELVETKGAQGLFYDVRDLLKLIRSTYSPTSRTAESQVLEPLMHAEVVVLDDLGAEKPSEWVEETLTHIITTRYNTKRPTIVTTNFEDSPDELDLMSLRARLGFRIHSRLHQMCEFLEFSGGDYRFLPPNGGAADLATLWKMQRRSRAGLARSLGVPGRTRAQVRSSLVPPPGRPQSA